MVPYSSLFSATVPQSQPSVGRRPNCGALAAIVVTAEAAVETRLQIGNPGRPAWISALRPIFTLLMAAYSSTGHPAAALIPRMLSRAGILMESTSGIDA